MPRGRILGARPGAARACHRARTERSRLCARQPRQLRPAGWSRDRLAAARKPGRLARRRRSASSACPPASCRCVSVVGCATGAHGGRLAAYSQGDGASFLPGRPFAEGERVTVRALLRSGRTTKVAAGHLRDRASGHDQLHSRDDPSRERRGGPELPLAARPAPAGGDRDRPLAAEAPADDMLVAPYAGPGPGGTDDPRPERQPGVVQAAPDATPRRPTCRSRNTRANRC